MFENNYYYGGLIYKSKKTNIIYSLLNGETSENKSSDIVFIFREPTEEEQEKNDYYGEVVNWCYDGFSELEYVEKLIDEYEETIQQDQALEIDYNGEYLRGKAYLLIEYFKKEIKAELEQKDQINQVLIDNIQDFLDIIKELEEQEENDILTIKECQMGGYMIERGEN